MCVGERRQAKRRGRTAGAIVDLPNEEVTENGGQGRDERREWEATDCRGKSRARLWL